jgi:hypothetical protein
MCTARGGLLGWRTCIDEERGGCGSVEVGGRRIVQGNNPPVLAVIADRLAQPEGQWRPFRPYPWAKVWYPRPASWRAS